MDVSAHVNDTDTDEAAVRDLLQRLNAAWGDADLYGTIFTEDADYVVFDGSHAKGRAEIVEMHRPLFEGFMKGSRLAGETTAVRFLASGVALAHSKGAVLRAGQKQASRRAVSVQTLVVVKQEGRWLVAAFQNTRYRPFAESLLGKILMRFAPQGSK